MVLHKYSNISNLLLSSLKIEIRIRYIFPLQSLFLFWVIYSVKVLNYLLWCLKLFIQIINISFSINYLKIFISQIIQPISLINVWTKKKSLHSYFLFLFPLSLINRKIFLYHFWLLFLSYSTLVTINFTQFLLIFMSLISFLQTFFLNPNIVTIVPHFLEEKKN